ncbi:unnamed protein product [Schistosoma margrebowiei]|uniref:Protein-tyrosine-phosphatase n=1 Tax=Schistosoma margrebowiei TaxID=48269 RepID=A0A3P7ZX01_9TREM|nr:unnamed protein product [Schistosoma margrebowiei]
MSRLRCFRDDNPAIKRRIYNASVRAVLFYACETWPLRVEDVRRLLCLIIVVSGGLLTSSGNTMSVMQRFGIGYHRRAAYIAAQGPIPSTFDDFWLMVWEQNSNVIVMISNFVERGRVGLSDNDLLVLTSGSKDRLVYHYQYTDWRDFDVPPSPLPVLKFVEASVTHWTFDKGPIVVHCSAGVGRTGTYICIESLIRQLKVEQAVSVRGFLEHIRQQRMKLVQTEQQYAFIHDALREYILYPYHSIRPLDFSDYMRHLYELDSTGTSNLMKQFEMCMDFRCDSAGSLHSGTLSVDQTKLPMCTSSDISVGGGVSNEINSRIVKARAAYANLSRLRCFRDDNPAIKRRIYNASVRAVLFYACETWPLRVEDVRRLLCLIIVVSGGLLTSSGNTMSVMQRFGIVCSGSATIIQLMSPP